MDIKKIISLLQENGLLTRKKKKQIEKTLLNNKNLLKTNKVKIIDNIKINTNRSLNIFKKIKIGKIITLIIITIIFFISPKLFLFLITNFVLFHYYKLVCRRVDLRNKIKQEKLEKYESKDEGIKKRMENLKQFNKAV